MGILSWTNNEYEWKHIDISWEGKNMIQLGGSQVAIHFGALRIEKASCDCMLPLGISDGQQRGHTHTHPPFAGWSTKLSGPKPQTKHDASWHLGIEAKAVTLTEPDRNVDVFLAKQNGETIIVRLLEQFLLAESSCDPNPWHWKTSELVIGSMSSRFLSHGQVVKGDFYLVQKWLNTAYHCSLLW